MSAAKGSCEPKALPSEHSPDLGECSPGLGECSPGLGEHSPDLGERSPDVGEHSPASGEHSPRSGERSPEPLPDDGARRVRQAGLAVRSDYALTDPPRAWLSWGVLYIEWMDTEGAPANADN